MLSCTSALRNFCRFIHSFSSSLSTGSGCSLCANSFKLHRPQRGGADGADGGGDGKMGRKLKLRRVVTAVSQPAAVGAGVELPSVPSACALSTELVPPLQALGSTSTWGWGMYLGVGGD